MPHSTFGQGGQPGILIMHVFTHPIAHRFVFSALFVGLALVVSAPALAADTPPLRALLILGGCCHDYATQKDLLEAGIEARANVEVDVIFSDDKSTKPPLSIYGNAKYADGYDVVIHDECAADIKDLAVVEGVLAPHREGIPAVNLHCAMHSYRTAPDVKVETKPGTADSLWFDYLGVQSAGHGPQKPVAIVYTDKNHPITKKLADWTTIKEELYNNIAVRPGAKVIARGSQEPNDKPNFTEAAVAWTNEYGDKKTRVFSTTIGHNNETVGDERYLDLVTNGVLWACGKLLDTGIAEDGYGPIAR
ncbi:MAG TPA: ThuA domain-containing protein [Candidatus Hydrogenedentes bacterium]|nr:ThuA domain-containing protein [Candidatus Hydrogenedentota bacterium]HRK34976.1 ThuA domain-containing protein [Candidatus Hydrogenedentota bacterium]